MAAFWTQPDFDDHELVHFVHQPEIGLTAIIALHSTHLGPGGGGTRFWHYADPADALTDALRLSRGMSYKNAMAGLPMGGGKGVILADPGRTKTAEMLAVYGDAIETLGGRYVTAEDVGMTADDMLAIWDRTDHVSGLPVEEGMAGGDPGPFTAYGIYLGIKAAVLHRLGRDNLGGVRVALQGVGSVGGGVARLLARDGARLTVADLDAGKAQRLSDELGAKVVATEAVMSVPCEVFSPNSLGAILDETSIPKLACAIVAGGANNQLARPGHGEILAARDILYAPDFVINAGGIIDVVLEYLGRRAGQRATAAEVNARIEQIPARLAAVWHEAAQTGRSPDVVAEDMARKLIGRA
jgi:leucine dehydrogenase